MTGRPGGQTDIRRFHTNGGCRCCHIFVRRLREMRRPDFPAAGSPWQSEWRRQLAESACSRTTDAAEAAFASRTAKPRRCNRIPPSLRALAKPDQTLSERASRASSDCEGYIRSHWRGCQGGAPNPRRIKRPPWTCTALSHRVPAAALRFCWARQSRPKLRLLPTAIADTRHRKRAFLVKGNRPLPTGRELCTKD